jgi:hypothetical protein
MSQQLEAIKRSELLKRLVLDRQSAEKSVMFPNYYWINKPRKWWG